MARYTHQEAYNRLKTGYLLYAYAYRTNNDKESMGLRCKPVLGVLAARRNNITKPGEDRPQYFIPYGKNNKPCYSRAVSLCARKYADTMQEAIDGYHAEIKECIQWHENRIEELYFDLHEQLPTG